MTDPGWYKDKANPELARWHDGTGWTDHTLVIADQDPGTRPAPPSAWVPAAPPAASKGDLAAEKARAKAERPWFRKKRYLLSIAFGVLMVIAVASSGGDDDKVATDTTDRPASEPDGPSSAQSRKSELDDVRATSCEVAYGFATIGLQVVNNSSKESNYVITLGLIDSTGAKVGDGFGSTNNLKPGQTANIEGGGTVSDAAQGAVSCVVEEVERYAS